MHDFLLKEILYTDIEQELSSIGFDGSYIKKAANKFEYKNIKIYNLTPAQANILKQTALTVGADCATHRDVITGKAEISSCILGGSISQIDKISQKLSSQPFGLKILGELLKQKITYKDFQQTKIIGILNITKDSFSDGGDFYETDKAISHLNQLISDGADIIDIGAESTKPYSKPISPQEQMEKLIPILDYIKNNNINIPISIDTRSSIVAQKCIEMGASIINDVSGLDFDEQMADIIAKNNSKVIIQHSKGTPETMQNNPKYENLLDEIYFNLNKKVDFAIGKGIKKDNIIIDPGIGFGKTKSHNLEIIRRWKELKTIGCPILIGLSRKSFLGIQDASNQEKDLYSLAFDSILMNEGIDYIRVHNVSIHKKYQNMTTPTY